LTTQRIVHLAAAADGAPISEAMRGQLACQALIPAGLCQTALPQAHENAVLVFVLTEQALADAAVRVYAALAAGSRFAILPVVPRRDRFDFRTLTGELEFLGRLNAVGWDDGEVPGAAVLTAIRRHLGLEPFQRDCRLFISYRRSDGTEAAQAIYRHFRAIGFDAFLDTEDEAIEPGEEVQARIHEAIPEKDFLLLVDSPAAAESGWVREEVSTALADRVAIFVVRVGGSEGFPQVRDLPALEWGPDPDQSLFDLERAVRSQLAARRSFDRRLMQTLEHLKPLLPLRISPQGRRRLLLTLGEGSGARCCLLDYEDAPYNLTRLHRLALGHQQLGAGGHLERAVLIHRGRRLSADEQAAVDWARGDLPLQVLALDQVVSFFQPAA
jgi:hypothetical protein